MEIPLKIIFLQSSLDVFLFIFLANFTAYLIIYPVFCKGNFIKIINLDVVFSCISLLIVGINYWNSGVVFYFLKIEINWFLFYIIHYLIIEGVFLFFYSRYFKLDLFGPNK